MNPYHAKKNLLNKRFNHLILCLATAIHNLTWLKTTYICLTLPFKPSRCIKAKKREDTPKNEEDCAKIVVDVIDELFKYNKQYNTCDISYVKCIVLYCLLYCIVYYIYVTYARSKCS